MFQIFAMIFFSIAGVAAIGAMLMTIAESWDAVKYALGVDSRSSPLPLLPSARVRAARTSPTIVVRPVLRAAA